jgi:hypothetical protein
VGEKNTLRSPPPPPPPPGPLLWGGGEGTNYAFRGKGRGLGSFWGEVLRKYLKRDLKIFTGTVIFQSLFASDSFRFHFFRCLECFACMRTKRKNLRIFAYFRFKRI